MAVVASIQNKINLISNSCLKSIEDISLKSISGSATLKTNLSATDKKLSLNIFIFLRKNPSAIIKKSGIVALTLKIKFDIFSPANKKAKLKPSSPFL